MDDATTFDSAAIGTQLAQAADAQIGSIVSSNGDITITRASGETVSGAQGTPIFANDNVVTGPGASVGFEFVDFSTFSLGESAEILLDELVYDPGADSSMVVSLVAGTFSFVSGEIAKSGDDSMQIVTPVATIGIRGTAGAGDTNSAVLLEEQGQETGELSFRTQAGEEILNQPNDYTRADSPFDTPDAKITLPLNQVQSQFGSALQELPTTLPANENIQRPGVGNTNQNNNDDDSGGGNGQQQENDDGADAGDGDGEQSAEEGEGEAEGEGEEVAEGDEDLAEDEEGLEEGEEALAEEGEEGVAEGAEEGEEGVAEGAEDGEEGIAEGAEDGEEGIAEGAEDGEEGIAEGAGEGEDGVAEGAGEGEEGLAEGAGDGDEGVAEGGTEGPEEGSQLAAASDDQPPPDSNDGPQEGGGDPQDGGEQPQAGVDNGQDGGGEQGASNDGAAEDSGSLFGGGFGSGAGGGFGGFDGAGGLGGDTGGLGGDGGLGGEGGLGGGLGGGGGLDGGDGDDFFNLDGDGDFFGLDGGGIDDGEGGDEGPGDGEEDIIVEDEEDDPVVEEDPPIEDPPGGDITLTDSGTVTLTGGVADTVNIDGGGLTATLVGTAEAIDTFNDFGASSGQTITFTDDAAHDVFVNGIENVNFGVLSNTVSVTVGGPDVVTIDGAGTFLFDLFGDGTDNTVQIDGAGAGTVSGDVNLGGGTDILELLDGGSSIVSVLSTETVRTGNSSHSITFGDSGTLDSTGGTGAQDLTLLSGVSVVWQGQDANIGSTTFSAGNESLFIEFEAIGKIFDGLGGTDTLDFSGPGGQASGVTIENFENFIGGDLNDDVLSNTFLQSGSSLDGGAGTDLLTIQGGTNTFSVLNFEQVASVGGVTDDIFLENNVSNVTFNLSGGGVDTINLFAGGANSLSVQTTEAVVGGAGNDTVTALDQIGNVNLGGGFDIFEISAGLTITANISGVENINGQVGTSESLTVLTDLVGTTVNLGTTAGDDLILSGNGTNNVTFVDINSVIGGTGADTAVFNGSGAATVDLGAGVDFVSVTSALSNFGSMTNVENFDGGTGDDTVTLALGLVAGDSFQGGGQTTADVLNLTGITGHVGSIFNFETVNVILPGSSVTLENAEVTNQQFNFTSGTATLDLADGTNVVTFNADLASTANIIGGTGNDTVNLTGGFNAGTVDLGAGFDVIDASTSVGVVQTQFQNVEVFSGSAGDDTVKLTNGLVAGDVFAGGGNSAGDTLELLGNTFHTGTITEFETVKVTVAGSTVVLEVGDAGNQEFIFTAGTNSLTLGAGTNIVSVNDSTNSGINITGNTGDDTVNLTASVDSGLINLGGGNDTLDASVSGGVVNTSIDGVNTFVGSAVSDSILVLDGLAGGSTYDGGAGFDVVGLLNATNSVNFSGFEVVKMEIANSTLTLGANINDNASFVFTSGTNALTLAGGGNTITVDAELGFGNIGVFGGAGDDLVNLAGSHISSNFSLGAGNDTVQLEQGAFTSASFTDVETVLGTVPGIENLTVENTQNGTLFDIGVSGGDNITFNSAGNNVATFANVHQVISSSGDDNFTFTGTGVIDVQMGVGTDTLNIGSTQATFFAGISGVENLNGSAFDDTVFVDTGLTSGSIFDGQGGNNALQLNGLVNQASIFQFNTVDVTQNSAVLTLQASDNSNTIFSFSGGTNTLNLFDGGNTVTFNSEFVGNTDTINGNTGDDNVFITGDFLGGLIDLFSVGGNNIVDAAGAAVIDTALANVNTFIGSTNDDNIVLLTDMVSGDVFDGGGEVGIGDTLQLDALINTGSILNFRNINMSAQNATVTLEASDVTNQTFNFTVGGNTLDLGNFTQVVTVNSDAVGSTSTVVLGGTGDQNVTTTGSIRTVFDLGDGVDTMTASTSASDIFFFDNITDSLVATPDVINNFDSFDPTEDIDFSGFAFSSFNFIGTGNFQVNGTAEARFDDATDTLQVDTNDDGATDMAIVLNGVNAADLDASDFTV